MQSNPREDAELNTKNPCKNERAPFARGYPFMTTTKADFAYRIDRWDPSGNVVQRVADVDDLGGGNLRSRLQAVAGQLLYTAAGFPCNRGQPTDATH
jgi:hypothetical protein